VWALRSAGFIVNGLASLLAIVTAHAVTLNFPNFGLTSSPQAVRTWAQKQEFASTKPASGAQEAYQRRFANGQRHTVSFVAGRQGLDMLQFEQAGVLESAAGLRRKVYRQFGRPKHDQTLRGGALRLIYGYEHSEPARRVFIIRPHYVSMLLMTDAYVSRVNHMFDRAAHQARQKQQAAERAARNAWLLPLLWVGGILLGFAGLTIVTPRSPTNPAARLLRSGLDGLFGLTQDVAVFIYYQAAGFLLFGMFLLSALAVGSGGAEWGTSWWWGVPILFGVVSMYKAFDEDFHPWGWVAIGFYALALAGTIMQHSWTNG